MLDRLVLCLSVPQISSENLPYFVLTQVREARRYFLDVAPKPASQIAVVCGGCERMQPDYVVDRSTFPFYVIEFVAEGAGSVELVVRRYPLQAALTVSFGPRLSLSVRQLAVTPS